MKPALYLFLVAIGIAMVALFYELADWFGREDA